jgi:rhodanese-related sulfurtransferase
MPRHRDFKNALYGQFARLGQALASPKRIELLDLLSQAEKTVESLADQAAIPVKNTSAHLRVLRQASLVDTRRDGTYVHYRLADPEVSRLLQAFQALGHRQLADVERVVRHYLAGRDEFEPVTLRELRRLLREGEVTLVDVRPSGEFEAGHIPGAISLPVADLTRRLGDVPRGREVIAYCRGRYCVFSLEAVSVLRKHGFHARRAEAGLPEWRAARWPVEVGR